MWLRCEVVQSIACFKGSLHPLLNAVPGQRKWQRVCRDDDGGFGGGIVVAVAEVEVSFGIL